MSSNSSSTSGLNTLHAHHPRRWRDFRYVYPVISRRSGGLSVGINLNRDKRCNWQCVYCQVDRHSRPRDRVIQLDRLKVELDGLLDLIQSGNLWSDDRFSCTPLESRRLNDIAFSGDGEPTLCSAFDQAIHIVATALITHHLPGVKLIVLTNMTTAHRAPIRRALRFMGQHNGEIWAKLDAGSEEDFRKINRSRSSFELVLRNIHDIAMTQPIVLQTMICCSAHNRQSLLNERAYIETVSDLINSGCNIKRIDLYTVARPVVDSHVIAAPDDTLDNLAIRLRAHHRLMRCRVFYRITR